MGFSGGWRGCLFIHFFLTSTDLWSSIQTKSKLVSVSLSKVQYLIIQLSVFYFYLFIFGLLNSRKDYSMFPVKVSPLLYKLLSVLVCKYIPMIEQFKKHYNNEGKFVLKFLS